MNERFGEFVDASAVGLLRFGTLLTGGDHHAASDLVQDALIEVGRRWSRLESIDQPLAYTKRVMANAYARQRRRVGREVLTPSPAEPGRVSLPDDLPIESAMWSALSTLPPRQRAVLVLRYYEDQSEEQIARALGCSRGTVKSQASRAMDKLRREMGDDERPSAPSAAAESTEEGRR